MIARFLPLMLALALATPALADIITRTIEYRDGDTVLEGFLAYDDNIPENERRPAVLIIHEWWGLDDYARRRAREIAELGYVAFALDMFGKDVTASTVPEAQALVAPLYQDRTLLRKRAKAGLDVLREQPSVDIARLAAIGYCFGGTTALELARGGADLSLVISFHGGLSTPSPAQAGAILARIIVMNGAADPLVPAEERQAFMEEMTRAKADWQFIEFGGAVHSFTNPQADKHNIPGVAYDKQADERSWRIMKLAFEETLQAE